MRSQKAPRRTRASPANAASDMYESIPDRRERLRSTEGSFAAELCANLRCRIIGREAACPRVVEAAVDCGEIRLRGVIGPRALRLDAARRFEQRLLILRGPTIDLGEHVL